MSDCSTPGGCGPSTTVCGTGGWKGPLPGDPDNNVVLTAVPGYGGVLLYWTMPTINPHAVAHFRLFRGISGNLEDAIMLGVTNSTRYFDGDVGSDIREYFYWIQIVTINGTELFHVGPSSAIPMPAISKILEDLAGKVEERALATSLRSRIDTIVDLEAGLTILSNLVTSENEVFGQELLALRNDVTNSMAYIDEQNTIRISEQAALVSSVNTLVAQMGTDISVAIQQEMSAVAKDIGDLQAQYSLKLDLAGYVSGFGLSAAVDPEGNSFSEFGVLASSFFIAPPSVVQATEPLNPFHGKVWVDTSGATPVTKWYNRLTLSWQTTPVKGAVPFIVKTEPEDMGGYTVQPGVYMDSAYITRLSAEQIDTRGLTIRDNFGNLILGAGTGLDWNLVRGVNKPQDGATRVVFRGDWTNSTVYQVGDTVLFNGSGWAAREQHTSSESNQPPSSGNQNTWWNAFAVKGNDGESALTTIVPNESHTLPASFDGVVSSYAGSGTTIQVFEGATALNAVSTLSANGQFTVGVPTQSPVSTLNVGGRTFSGTTATVAQHIGMVSGTDTVIITYPITARTSTGNVISYSVTQTLTKSKAGATGTPGAQGPAVVVTSSRSLTFTATDGVLDVGQQDIVLTAAVQGITSPTYVWEFNGFEIEPTTSTSNTQTVTSTQLGVSRSATVTCVVNGLYRDQVTIVKLDQTNSLTADQIKSGILPPSTNVSAGSIMISGQGFIEIDGASQRTRLTEGNVITYLKVPGVGDIPYQSLTHVEVGVCQNNTEVVIPGFFRTQPRVLVSPAELGVYNRNFSAQSQTLVCTTGAVTQTGPNTYRWRFTPTATLSLLGTEQIVAINANSGTLTTNSHTTTVRQAPGNTDRLTIEMQFLSVRGTGTSGSFHNRQVTWQIQFSSDNVNWTNGVSTVVAIGNTTSTHVASTLVQPLPSAAAWFWRCACTAADTGATFSTGAAQYNYAQATVGGSTNLPNVYVDSATATSLDQDVTVTMNGYSPPAGYTIYQVDYSYTLNYTLWATSASSLATGTGTIRDQNNGNVNSISSTNQNDLSITSSWTRNFTQASFTTSFKGGNCLATRSNGAAARSRINSSSVTSTVYSRQLITNSTTPANNFNLISSHARIAGAQVLASGTLNWMAVGE